MRSAILFLAMLVLVSTLIAGCGCLAADSYYAKPAECEKYHTDWPRQHNETRGSKNGIKWDSVFAGVLKLRQHE